jgi:hypothetical protein
MSTRFVATLSRIAAWMRDSSRIGRMMEYAGSAARAGFRK